MDKSSARVGVLMGGMSAERGVSMKTGAAVLDALVSRGWDAVAIEVGRDLPARLVDQGVTVAWIALHGRFGEDGCVQGVCEVMGIPYTGSGVQASAVGMDKLATKRAVSGHGIRMAEHVVVRRGEARPELPVPSVVKPAVGGSSFGTTVVMDRGALDAALDDALRYDAAALVEEFVQGEEITVALLRENSLFGVLSLLTGHRSDRFYHSVAFTRVEMITAPAASVRQAIEADASVGLLLLQGLSSRILQTETMIETLTHRDMSSRLVSFLLVLCRDFGVPGDRGITIDLRLSHQAIAEAIGSTRVTITRLLGDLRNAGLVEIDRKKITVLDPIALAKKFS